MGLRHLASVTTRRSGDRVRRVFRVGVAATLVVAAVVAGPSPAFAQNDSVTVSDASIRQTIFTANTARAHVTDPAGAPVPNGTPVQFHIAGPLGVFTEIGPVVDMRRNPQGAGYWLVTVRGQVAARDGKFVGKAGRGRFLEREPSHF